MQQRLQFSEKNAHPSPHVPGNHRRFPSRTSGVPVSWQLSVSAVVFDQAEDKPVAPALRQPAAFIPIVTLARMARSWRTTGMRGSKFMMYVQIIRLNCPKHKEDC
jgi:hypothetical protein